MADPVDEETARKRWMAIQTARFAGVALVLIGILIRYAVIPAPLAVGIGLIVLGLVGTFFVPTLLARRWRTPPS
jgi:pilus assembly protein TadC